MSRNLIRARWAAFGAAVAVALGGGTVIVANAAKVDTVSFTAITPCRILDTRITDADDNLSGDVKPLGPRRGAVGPTTANDITVIFDTAAKYDPVTAANSYQITGMNNHRALMGQCDDRIGAPNADPKLDPDIPNNRVIEALLLNVTSVTATADGFITIYPWVQDPTAAPPAGRPLISNLNTYTTPPARFNAVTVPLTAISSEPISIPGVLCAVDGVRGTTPKCAGKRAFRVFNRSGTTHLVIDLMGYYWKPAP